MALLIIQATENTPRVYFDLNQGRLELRGRCFPDDTSKFFNPVLSWLSEHIGNQSVIARFEVYLEYYNTGTYIRLLELFDLLGDKNTQGHEIEVHWYVQEEDEDSIDNAESFMDVTKVPFKLRTLPTINFDGV